MANFAASIIARLGLDTTGFRSELSNAASAADGAHSRMAGAASRNTAAHENLLSSNHRVARQIQNFSKDLLSGASAADVLSGGLEGLERALKLPLGALAGLGIGAIAVTQISKVVDEYKKLNAEIEKLEAPRVGAGNRTLAEIGKSLDSTTEKLEVLKKEASKGGFGGFVRDLVRSFGGGNALKGESEFGAVRRLRREQISGLESARGQDFRAEIAKMAQNNALHGQPDFIQKAAAIEEKFLDVVQRLGQGGVVELDNELKNLREDVAQTRQDVLKLSLKDLQEKGPTFADGNSASLEAINNAENARKIGALQKEIENIRFHNPENLGGIDERRGRIASLASPDNITSLKSGDRNDLLGAYKGALESAGVFKEMIAAIRAISFANQ